MARSHARILTAIWSDPDFTQLREAEQRAYLLAVSQPELSYAGVLPFTIRRWQRLATDTTPTKLRRTFFALQERLYVLIDEATEEMWVRTFVKNDGVLTNPNVAKASLQAYRAIHSDTIRGAFICEMHRLTADPHQTTDWDKGWKAGLADVLHDPLPKDFPNPLLNPFPEWSEYARAAPVFPLQDSPAPCDHGAASPSGCAECRSQTNAAGIEQARAALGAVVGSKR